MNASYELTIPLEELDAAVLKGIDAWLDTSAVGNYVRTTPALGRIVYRVQFTGAEIGTVDMWVAKGHSWILFTEKKEPFGDLVSYLWGRLYGQGGALGVA